MVHYRQVQRLLWEGVLPDADKLWSPPLRRLDALLEDAAVLEPVAQALARRWPASRSRGRRGTPVDVVVRMLVLKHLYRWSYDALEREVRANLVYRAFSRVGAGPVPDAKTILKIAQALGPDTIQALHRRVVALAIAQGVTRGRRLRIDTTVVETPIHYPTDSTLLADGVRVLTRTLGRVAALVGTGGRQLRDRRRSVVRRVFAIAAAARRLQTRPVFRRHYRALLALTRAVVRDAETMGRRVSQHFRRVPAATRPQLARLQRTLRTTLPLVRRVIHQTVARVLHGDEHAPGKVLSLFEPHTEAIRKGKVVKPTEFGKLVAIQEAEHQVITAYTVYPVRPADRTLWVPALDVHQELFGRAPRLAAADRGFSSAANEHAATARGVRRVVLPHQGRRSPARRAHERQRWFRRGQRWRVGCEGRISVLKRRHGLERCGYHGPAGTERWVGLGVIAHNLLTIAMAT
jgi:IS5 family transposase